VIYNTKRLFAPEISEADDCSDNTTGRSIGANSHEVLRSLPISRGTGSSNLFPSSGESGASQSELRTSRSVTICGQCALPDRTQRKLRLANCAACRFGNDARLLMVSTDPGKARPTDPHRRHWREGHGVPTQIVPSDSRSAAEHRSGHRAASRVRPRFLLELHVQRGQCRAEAERSCCKQHVLSGWVDRRTRRVGRCRAFEAETIQTGASWMWLARYSAAAAQPYPRVVCHLTICASPALVLEQRQVDLVVTRGFAIPPADDHLQGELLFADSIFVIAGIKNPGRNETG
jgi:hypothetical protein